MSTIQQTVETTMRNDNRMRSYTGYATPVIAALKAREEEATAALIQFAVDKGLTEDEARSAIAGTGLSVAEPVAAAVDPGLVNRLAAFARQHGFRG